ncbi:MAG: DNA-directed RNA polymerase I core subunit rpa12 [Cirrosporium novae-zelandiae]|nr:MAG: DNA-directed RNA polymerase I core subunit rpa12 [Cirrosporium novae-zelandiae]
MSAIGSLVFCTDCGNLLDGSSTSNQSILVCNTCGQRNEDTSSKTIISKSKPSAFPSSLRAKRSAVQTTTANEAQTTARIKQTCPECGSPEMRYYTQQLRSADEGSTVFYVCDCGYTYNENN